MDGWVDEKEELEAKEELLASAWDLLSFRVFPPPPFIPQWSADPGNGDRAPSSPSAGPWPPFLSLTKSLDRRFC